jgi:hypothetical protein
MKKITILFAIIAMTGCTAFKDARRHANLDWYNFKRTIQLNLNQPAVYKYSYY